MNQSKYILMAIAILILVLTFWYMERTPTPVVTIDVPIKTPTVAVSESTYASSTLGISLSYPLAYSVDEQYRYQALGPGKDIRGVKFTIPTSVAAGTNLSTDSYLSIERIIGTNVCSASIFLGEGIVAHTVVDGNVSYSVASTTGAAAGNRYAETVYALPGDPCIAVRYMVHYGVFENYPEGTIREFDRAALHKQFDVIRRALVVSIPTGKLSVSGSVTLVDTKQSEIDGPLLISVKDADGVVVIVAVPARGLGLCAAKANITDAFSAKAGDKVEVSGALDASGRIVPCSIADDYFRKAK